MAFNRELHLHDSGVRQRVLHTTRSSLFRSRDTLTEIAIVGGFFLSLIGFSVLGGVVDARSRNLQRERPPQIEKVTDPRAEEIMKPGTGIKIEKTASK